MMAIGFIFFSLFIIGLELFTGCAMIGWAGDKMVVEREESPGPYWFAVTLHIMLGVGFPLFILLAD